MGGYNTWKSWSLPIVNILTSNPLSFAFSTCLPWGSFVKTMYLLAYSQGSLEDFFFFVYRKCKWAFWKWEHLNEIHQCKSIFISFHCCYWPFVVRLALTQLQNNRMTQVVPYPTPRSPQPIHHVPSLLWLDYCLVLLIYTLLWKWQLFQFSFSD